MARTIVSPPRTTRGSPPARRHSSTTASAAAVTTSIASTPAITALINASTSTAGTNTPSALPRPNVPIAPASSSTSSPIYSTTSSPPVSPGVNQQQQQQQQQQHQQQPGSSVGTMGPRNDTRSNPLAFDLAPTSTPTGRISKAKKGKRVHACEFPGCGKIFTRAEHKRRHELNHNPDASYRCAQPGCGKSFHRLDLLQRHQERHDIDVHESRPNRSYPTHSSALPDSAPLPTTSIPPTQDGGPVPRSNTNGVSISSLVNPHSHTYHGTEPFGMGGMGAYHPIPFYPMDEHVFVAGLNHSPHHTRPSVSGASSETSAFEHNAASPMVPPAPMPTAWSDPPSVIDHMFAGPDMSAQYHPLLPGQLPPSPIWTDGSGITLDESYQMCQDYYPVLTEPAYAIL